MKKYITSQVLNALYILFLIVISSTACKKHYDNPDNSDDDFVAPGDEIVAWIKPDNTHEEYESWLNSLKDRFGHDIHEEDRCGSCDNTLVVLKGAGIRNYIQRGGTVSGSTKPSTSLPNVTPTDPTGEDGPMYVSRNFYITFSEPISSSNFYSITQPTSTYPGTTVKVAVLDTGVDTTGFNNFTYNSSGPSCIAGADNGWNFVNQIPNYNDDNAIRHGTVVTRLITDEVAKYKGNKVEILPVKTHNKDGVSNLAQILCAFAYAKERGANIINASFGFYLQPRDQYNDTINSNALLLKEFVHHYLTKNNILLVAAAGNMAPVVKENAWFYGVQGLADINLLRNLDVVAFLPASLAQMQSFQNVIAVTTVDQLTKTASPRQNYSPNVVDIGVNADTIIGDYYVFDNPLLDSIGTVEGSSFATAIMTGILSANYDKFKSILMKGNYTKEDIWNKLSPIVESDPELAGKIKAGRYVNK